MMIGEFANSVITFAKELESRALLMSNGDEKDVLYRTVLATTKAIIGYCEILRDEVPSAHPKHFRDLTKKVDVISRQATIEALDVGAEVLRRVLDDADVVGVERAKYEWGLSLIESHIADVKDLPSAEPEIIRCKDCENWRQQTNYQGAPLSFGFCESDDMWRSLYGETYEVSHIDTDDDFYCGHAERRTDEADYRKE